MNRIAQAIKNRLSLRQPQAESLAILTSLTDKLALTSTHDLEKELQIVRHNYPTCQNFERDFPSITFSLATGVGKTRLMGAFIAYLYLEKGVKNFFVLAPNLTIYNKLIDDLSKPDNPKYVFTGISEFVDNPPVIITGDNYSERGRQMALGETIRINIFNIQRINSEVRGGNEPRIKRLSEYIGDSYFNYLAALPDLVMIMDESHHYRADAGLKAINDLKPILGLELTATPIDNAGQKFKNVVFEYPLSKALEDGFVKEPAIATRENFDPSQYRNDPQALDDIKLNDGIKLHEATKTALDIYARDTGSKAVKPFVLVVAKDTDHAKEIRDHIESERFFGGQYKGKVMEIHSSQRGSEKEENVQKLLTLEDPSNPVEIVVHVNMLKEGWDVTNLYTIIPLRAANSQILTEQTIGRGLRLPYGKRTGVKEVDTLTIIAHDRFQAIVEEANKPGSIIRQGNIIQINPEELPDRQEVVSVSSLGSSYVEQLREKLRAAESEEERKQASASVQIAEIAEQAVQGLANKGISIDRLEDSEVQQLALESYLQHLNIQPQQELFVEERLNEAREAIASISRNYKKNVIPIPRIQIQQSGDIQSGFHDFDLDTRNLNLQPVSEDLIRHTLRTNESDVLKAVGDSSTIRDSAPNILVSELINYSDIDYDRDSNLLYKLVHQALDKLGIGRSENDLSNIITYYKREVAKYIYTQMKQHFFVQEASFEAVEVKPFSKIERHNYAKFTKDSIRDFRETIIPTSAIRTLLFGGFGKACHPNYKFDSKSEKDFAILLENTSSADVLRWLRPAPSQFKIYWAHNSRTYEPDFIVETDHTIYMVEVKAENETDDEEVLEKAISGISYCDISNQHRDLSHSKPWEYLLVPHTQISLNSSFSHLASRFRLTRDMVEIRRQKTDSKHYSSQPTLIDDELWEGGLTA